MTDFGCTGTHSMLTEKEAHYVRRVTRRALVPRKTGVPKPRTKKFPHNLYSGCAFGVDSECVLAVWGLIPFENIYLVVPGTAKHNYALVDKAAKEGAHIIKSRNLHTVSATYLHRNEVLVDNLEVLLAFPKKPTYYRSGTFATINYAHHVKRKVRMYPLVNS